MLLSLPSVAWPKAPIRGLVMDLVRGPRRSLPPSRRSPSRRSSPCARRSPFGSRRSRFGSCLSWGVELGPLPSGSLSKKLARGPRVQGFVVKAGRSGKRSVGRSVGRRIGCGFCSSHLEES